jgi:TolB protein
MGNKILIPLRRSGGVVLGGVVAAIIALVAIPNLDGASASARKCEGASAAISFISTRSGRGQIYKLDLRRPQLVTRITNLPGLVAYPTWSPDGRRMAFTWLHPGQASPGIYVAKADGSNVRLLVAQAGSPAWSPDGRLVAYTRLRQDSRGLSVVDVAKALRGRNPATRVITRVNPGIPEEWPAWAPDGKRLAFTSQRSGTSDIWVVDVTGSHLRNLTPRQPALDVGATWSPDGKQIIFGSDRAAGSQFGGDLYVMKADGSNVHALTSGHKEFGPAWSPDGRWIAFTSQRDGNPEIYLMRPDGTAPRRLTHQQKDDVSPGWVGRCP